MVPRSIHPSRHRVLNAVEQAPASSAVELAVAACMSHRSAKAYLCGLHEEGAIHVCGWRVNSPGSPSRLWAIGPGMDAPKPKPQTSAERQRKARAQPGAREREAELKRNRRRLNNLKGKSVLAAMLGV